MTVDVSRREQRPSPPTGAEVDTGACSYCWSRVESPNTGAGDPRWREVYVHHTKGVGEKCCYDCCRQGGPPPWDLSIPAPISREAWRRCFQACFEPFGSLR